MLPKLIYFANVHSAGAEVVDITKRFCQKCGLSALESWEAAIISGWDKKLSEGTIIMYREIASDGAFEWTKKIVIRINDNDSADDCTDFTSPKC